MGYPWFHHLQSTRNKAVVREGGRERRRSTIRTFIGFLWAEWHDGHGDFTGPGGMREKLRVFSLLEKTQS